MPKRILAVQARILWLTLIPMGLSGILVAMAGYIILILEKNGAGTTHTTYVLNATTIEGICNGMAYGNFKGIDLYLVSISSVVYSDLFLFFLFIPFKFGALLRMIGCTVVITPLTFVAHFILLPNGGVPLPYTIMAFLLGLWFPDVFRASCKRNLRRTMNISLVSLRTVLIQVIAVGTMFAFMILSLSNSGSTTLELALVGILYPILAVFLRFIIRRMVSKIAISGRIDESRVIRYKIRKLTNESSVTYFLLPGFLSMFLVNSDSSFISAISAQISIELCGAAIFAKFLRRTGEAMVSTVPRGITSVTPKYSVQAVFTKSESDIHNRGWEGIFSSEMLGEKRSIYVAAMISFCINKNLESLLWRILVAFVGKSLADAIKLFIYKSHNLVRQDFQISRSNYELFTASFSLAFAFFLAVSALSLFCFF